VAEWSLRVMPMQLPSMEVSDLLGEAITLVTTGAANPGRAQRSPEFRPTAQ